MSGNTTTDQQAQGLQSELANKLKSKVRVDSDVEDIIHIQEFAATGSVTQQPRTPASALPDRFTEQSHAFAQSTNGAQNGGEAHETHTQRRTNDDFSNAPQSLDMATVPLGVEQRLTSPAADVAVSEGAASATAMQPSPLAAAAPAHAQPTHARSPRANSANGSPRSAPATNGASAAWVPGPERPVLVFTSQLANEAVNVVYSGGCRSLAEFHYQRVGHRFLPPSSITKPPAAPPFADNRQRPALQPGPGRPADKSTRVAQWVATQQDSNEQEDELLKQRKAKLAKLDELERTLKLEESAQNNARVAPKLEPSSGSQSAAPAFTSPALNNATSPAAPPPPNDVGSTHPPVSSDGTSKDVKPELADVKSEVTGNRTHDSSTFARPQSAPSAGLSPSPAPASVQSPGSLNEPSLVTAAPITPTGGSKRRTSVAASSNQGDKPLESQPKPKRRRPPQRNSTSESAAQGPLPDCASMMPPGVNFDAKSPGACYALGRTMSSANNEAAPGPPRRSGSLGSTNFQDSPSLTSASLSKLAAMTYSMNNPNGTPPNGMPPPSLARSSSCHDESLRNFGSPPTGPNGTIMPPYDPAMRGPLRPPDTAGKVPYPPPNCRLPAPSNPQQPVNNTIINAHMSIQQMNIQSVNAPSGVNPLMHIQQVSHELASAAAAGMQNNLPPSVNLSQSSNIRVSFGTPLTAGQPPGPPTPSIPNVNRYASFDSVNGGNANVQIQHKAPNTIQYRPLADLAPRNEPPSATRPAPFGPQPPGPPPPPSMHDFSKMGANKMLSPGGNVFQLSPDDPRFAPNPSSVMMNGTYAQMNAPMQQHMSSGPGNYEVFPVGLPAYPDYAFRPPHPQQHFVAADSQYPPNPHQPTRMLQPDAPMSINMSQPNVSMNMNMFVHAPQGPPQHQAQSAEAQMNMQMQINAAQSQQPPFTVPQEAPYYNVPPQQNASGNSFDDADLELLVQCTSGNLLPFGNGGNNPPQGGFFGNCTPSGAPLPDDVDLFMQYANAGNGPSGPGMPNQTQGQSQSGPPGNMAVGMSMNVQQGVPRPPGHDPFGPGRFAYPNGGPVMQTGRFRSPGTMDLQMQTGAGTPMMSMAMQQQPIYDPGHGYY